MVSDTLRLDSGEPDYGYGDDTNISTDVPVPSSRPFGRRLPGSSVEDENGNNNINNNNANTIDRRAGHKRMSGKQRASIRASLRRSVRSLSQSRDVSFRDSESITSRDSLSVDGGSAASAAAAAAASLENESTGSRASLSMRGQLVRQESWFLDLVSQGISSQDLAEFLGDQGGGPAGGGGDGGEASGLGVNGGAAAAVVGDRDGIGSGKENDDTMLEQHLIMAHSLARRRLIELLGHDPWELKAKQDSQNHNPTTARNGNRINGMRFPPTGSAYSSSSSSRGPQQQQQQQQQNQHIIFPPSRNRSSVTPVERRLAIQNELRILAPLPSTPKELFTWSVSRECMEQKHHHYHNASELRQQQSQPVEPPPIVVPDLHMGEPVTKSAKAPPGYIIVRCLGCRQLQSVPMLTTLVRCCSCYTVSPASTTRK